MCKRNKLLLIIVVIFLSLILIIPTVSKSNNLTEIIFFNARKADSILIKNHEVTILIDAGLRENQDQLATNLKNLKIKNIDYLILTHPDKDHIGGASHLIASFNVKNVISSFFIKGSKREERVNKSINFSKTNNIVLEKSMQVKLKSLTIDIIVSENKHKNSNDNSLITVIKDRNLNYLFAGDAESDLILELLSLNLSDVDLYKVAHHGKNNKHSKAFIDKIKPKVSVVTNKSADKEVVLALEAVSSEIYYAYNKVVKMSSDGQSLTIIEKGDK